MSTRAIPIPKGATLGAPEAIPIPKGATIGDPSAASMTPQDMTAEANRQFAAEGLPAASSPGQSPMSVQGQFLSSDMPAYRDALGPSMQDVGNAVLGAVQSGYDTVRHALPGSLDAKITPAVRALGPMPGPAGKGGALAEQIGEFELLGPGEKGAELLGKIPGAGKGVSALGRILGNATGGGLSAALHGGPVAGGAALAGGLSGAAEGLGASAPALRKAAQAQYGRFFGSNGREINAITKEIIPELLDRRVRASSAQNLADLGGENFANAGEDIDKMLLQKIEEANRPNLSMKALPPPKESIGIPASPDAPPVDAIPAQRIDTINPIAMPRGVLPAHPITLEVPGREPTPLSHPIAHTPGMIMSPSPSPGPVNIEYLNETSKPVRASRGRYEPGGVVFHVPPTEPVPADARTVEGDMRSIGFEPHTEFTSEAKPRTPGIDRPRAYAGDLVRPVGQPKAPPATLNESAADRAFRAAHEPPTPGAPIERPLVNMRPIVGALEDMRGQYQVGGIANDEASQRALGNLDREISREKGRGDFISLRDARSLRQNLDRPLAQRGAFYGKPLDELSAMNQSLTKANALRGQIAETVPEIQPLNREAHFWGNVQKAAGARANKAPVSQGGLRRAVGYPLGAILGAVVEGPAGAAKAIGTAGLIEALSSPGWQTASAVTKNDIAKLADSGLFRRIAARLAHTGVPVLNAMSQK